MPSSFAIGSHFERFIQRQVESGRYSSASEVIRDALRLLEEREQLRQAQIKAIRTLIQEGRDSGASVPANEVLDRLEAKYSDLAPSQ